MLHMNPNFSMIIKLQKKILQEQENRLELGCLLSFTNFLEIRRVKSRALKDKSPILEAPKSELFEKKTFAVCLKCNKSLLTQIPHLSFFCSKRRNFSFRSNPALKTRKNVTFCPFYYSLSFPFFIWILDYFFFGALVVADFRRCF